MTKLESDFYHSLRNQVFSWSLYSVRVLDEKIIPEVSFILGQIGIEDPAFYRNTETMLLRLYLEKVINQKYV